MNVIWLNGGTLDVIEHEFVHINICVRPVIVATGATLLLERGCEVSRRAFELAIKRDVFVFCIRGNVAKLFLFVPVNATYSNLSKQMRFQSCDRVRNTIASHMLKERFGYCIHPNRGINVMRGFEGAAVRDVYHNLAAEYGISWQGRDIYGEWNNISLINKTISMCNSVLYNFTEIAILRAGCSPYLGFIHNVKDKSKKSLVYDIADMVKFELVTPIAFRCVADGRPHPEWRARATCARLFRQSSLLDYLTTITRGLIRVGENCITRRVSRKSRKIISNSLARN
ncbi:TPA: CRISPR-associated endonuclease Cas1 [Salmonella enterica]|nr:CRISPR-associated endonuclease Cas1 [Salmonella enterica]HAK8195209.1 CRISPR-associated endonuclease Cas1 [Salmonella enterica]HAK8434557.1 CRISPR-associated endonuclease Cas1 [Salmonella enterica]HAK8462305.1 CRISPR-associated endonuclease Cas1 [Salmonella enterica]